MISRVRIKKFLIGGAVLALVLAASCKLFSSSTRATGSGHKPGGVSPGSGRIEGVVMDEQRRPLAEVILVITATTARESYNEIAPVTNGKGEFSFPDLPPGRYTLRAAPDGFKAQTQDVTVEEGKTARAEFVLRR